MYNAKDENGYIDLTETLSYKQPSTKRKKDICFWNDRRNQFTNIVQTSSSEGISMGWYDMDQDVVHELICNDHRCTENHGGHRWEFEDQHHSWVINALRHKNI